MNVKTLYSEISPLPKFNLEVCTSKRQAAYVEKYYDVRLHWDEEAGGSSIAVTVPLKRIGENKELQYAAVVMFFDKELHGVALAEICAHEACHVADHYFDFIGEKNIGEEAYAYAVQITTAALWRLYESKK